MVLASDADSALAMDRALETHAEPAMAPVRSTARAAARSLPLLARGGQGSRVQHPRLRNCNCAINRHSTLNVNLKFSIFNFHFSMRGSRLRLDAKRANS